MNERVLFHFSEDDYGIEIPGPVLGISHVVDYGDTEYTEAQVTHRTRDGQAMQVHALTHRLLQRVQYVVSIHTGEPS